MRLAAHTQNLLWINANERIDDACRCDLDEAMGSARWNDNDIARANPLPYSSDKGLARRARTDLAQDSRIGNGFGRLKRAARHRNAFAFDDLRDLRNRIMNPSIGWCAAVSPGAQNHSHADVELRRNGYYAEHRIRECGGSIAVQCGRDLA